MKLWPPAQCSLTLRFDPELGGVEAELLSRLAAEERRFRRIGHPRNDF